MGKKQKEFLKKERKMLDTEVSIITLISHIITNFLYSFLGCMIIGAMIIGNAWLIGFVYLYYKTVEGKVFNRPRYDSNFGKKYIYPIPSLLGFMSGYYLTEYLKTIL